jgi:4-amino-4-deoxy-L-arabinose transferase-like glycosyltransferase
MANIKAGQVLIFALTLAALWFIVIIFPYEYRDSDSSCYSFISQKLATEPMSTWCAPQWRGHGGNQGYFREHPPGILWLPALLVRLGIKPSAAALCANFIYALLSLLLIFKLAGRGRDSMIGWGAAFGIVLTPAFLQYLVRANQELFLNLAILAGIYGLARFQESRGGGWIFAAALVLAVLVKGTSALLLSILAGLFWLIVARNRKTFVLIVIGHLAVLAVAGLFELWYRKITHQSFWLSYYSIQSPRTLGGGFDLLHKLYNLTWYAARVLVFAAPWVYFLLYAFFLSKKKRLGLFQEPFIRFLPIGSLAVILFFSLSDRKADRYVFPAYILSALAGLIVFLKTRPKVIEFLRAQESRLPAYLGVMLVVLTLIRVLFHSHLYSFVRFWSH